MVHGHGRSATNHIANNPGTLCSLFNKSNLSSVLVGNGSSTLVTKTSQTIIPSKTRPLHLNSVLVRPSIIKNLVSVRRFVTDNICTVEFDPFGFLSRIYKSGTICSDVIVSDRSTPSRHLTVNRKFSTLHLRPIQYGIVGLVIRGSLLSSLYFLLVLFHVISPIGQNYAILGKHARLPFYASSSIVTSPFEVIHSDIWTSPIESISGIKYYLIFLDDYSHFVWIYPLRRKTDVFSRYLYFAVVVRTHFHWEIRALQCDNGKEYDNHLFHDQFALTRTKFRFSCPYTSQ